MTTESVYGVMFPRTVDPELSRVLPKQEEGVDKAGKTSFTDHLYDALSQVDELQKTADQAREDLITGDLDELHQLMIKSEEAKLALQLTVQTTSKVIEAYQELYRMQI